MQATMSLIGQCNLNSIAKYNLKIYSLVIETRLMTCCLLSRDTDVFFFNLLLTIDIVYLEIESVYRKVPK